MSKFVNREKELKLIEDAFKALHDDQRLLPTPIIDFYGVDGIGKTMLLQQVEETCHRNQVLCEHRDVRKITAQYLTESVQKLLEENKPVVVILDSFDATSGKDLGEFEISLRDLVFQSSKVYVVLASKNMQKFDNTRSVAQKLTTFQLKPLSREYCLEYLDTTAKKIAPSIRETIYEWTCGYPLAMKVMTDAILNDEELDTTKPQDQITLINILMQEVIEKKLLASVTSPKEMVRLQTLLALLSIPRRFNLILIQYLVDRFAPEYKLASSLAYIALPPSIYEITSALSWNLERAGYCIDAPVRNLFLLQWKIKQPERYVAIHKFLAEKNESFAQQVNGSDYIRYLREVFYHLAHSESEAHLREILTQRVEQLVRVQVQDGTISLQSLDDFLQFYEEFQQDDELREALKPENTSFVLSLMRRIFIKIYRFLPAGTRGHYLRKFFSQTAYLAKTEDFALIFEDGIRQIIKQESLGDAIKLYQELKQDEELKDLLGENFDKVQKRIDVLLEEGQ